MRTRDKYDRDATQAAFDRIARLTRENGGGTFQRHTGAPVELTAGYTVGVGNVARAGVGASIDQNNVRATLIAYWPTTAPANAQYVGTWLDGAVLYIDHVTVIPTLTLALSLARKNGERSIYDNARGVCVSVEPCHYGRDTLGAVRECPPDCSCDAFDDDDDDWPVFCADAPADTVWWRDGEPFCPHCDASLADIGSVRYFEQYAAGLGQSPYGDCVEYFSDSVDSTAYCSVCGGTLDYKDVSAR